MNLLDDADIFIKDNLDEILIGKYSNQFSGLQKDKMLELSFLYNHLTILPKQDYLIFEYVDEVIRITNLYSQYSDLIYQIGKDGVKNMIVSTIINQDGFKSAFKLFLRDRKINTIIA